jgi:ribosomal protein S10
MVGIRPADPGGRIRRMEGRRTMSLAHGYLVGDISKVDLNPNQIKKPWEAMYRSILKRFAEIVENNEGMEAVERIVLFHVDLMKDYDRPDPLPTRQISYPHLAEPKPPQNEKTEQ